MPIIQYRVEYSYQRCLQFCTSFFTLGGYQGKSHRGLQFCTSFFTFGGWQDKGRKVYHFTLNCIPTPLRIVSRGLNMGQSQIQPTLGLAKSGTKLSINVNRILILLERFAILYQFFHAWRLPGEMLKGPHISLNCSIKESENDQDPRFQSNCLKNHSQVNMPSFQPKLNSYISDNSINSLNMIKTHAFSQILGVQNQVQNCPFSSIQQSTPTRERVNFVPVFPRLEVAR